MRLRNNSSAYRQSNNRDKKSLKCLSSEYTTISNHGAGRGVEKKNAYYQVSASCLKRRGCCYPDLFLSLQIQISPLNVPSRPLRRQTTSQGTKDGRRRVCADGTRRLDPRKQSDSEKLHNICTQKILACVGKYNKKDKKVTQLTCEQLVQAWLLLIMN